jgi:hypothetical protein
MSHVVEGKITAGISPYWAVAVIGACIFVYPVWESHKLSPIVSASWLFKLLALGGCHLALTVGEHAKQLGAIIAIGGCFVKPLR